MDDIIITTVGSWPTNPASVVGKVIRVPPKKRRVYLIKMRFVLEVGKILIKSIYTICFVIMISRSI